MRQLLIFSFLLMGLQVWSQPSYGVMDPNEMLADPALEARAREVSKDLRCVVCQNQSIDDSDSGIAKKMRLLVRDRIEKGDTNQEVKDYLVSRYGDFVLLKPPMKAKTYVLWFGPAFMVGVGLIGLFFFFKRRREDELQTVGRPPVTLSDKDQKRLDALMKEEESLS